MPKRVENAFILTCNVSLEYEKRYSSSVPVLPSCQLVLLSAIIINTFLIAHGAPVKLGMTNLTVNKYLSVYC